MYTSVTDRRHEKDVLSVGSLRSKTLKKGDKKKGHCKVFCVADKRNEKESCKASWVNVNSISVTSWETKIKTNIY